MPPDSAPPPRSPGDPELDLVDGRRALAALIASARSGRQPEPGAPLDALEEAPRRWSSRQLHRLGALAAHAWAGGAVALASIAYVGVGIAVGFPQWWIDALEVGTSTVTVVLLFALTHLQARDQTAVQRKLDEILRALPEADTTLVAIEEASDETLRALTALDRVDRPG